MMIKDKVVAIVVLIWNFIYHWNTSLYWRKVCDSPTQTFNLGKVKGKALKYRDTVSYSLCPEGQVADNAGGRVVFSIVSKCLIATIEWQHHYQYQC